MRSECIGSKNVELKKVLAFLFSSSVGATSCDGNFLVPPNRDGSVSPILGKRERSTSVIAGEELKNVSRTLLMDKKKKIIYRLIVLNPVPFWTKLVPNNESSSRNCIIQLPTFSLCTPFWGVPLEIEDSR